MSSAVCTLVGVRDDSTRHPANAPKNRLATVSTSNTTTASVIRKRTTLNSDADICLMLSLPPVSNKSRPDRFGQPGPRHEATRSINSPSLPEQLRSGDLDNFFRGPVLRDLNHKLICNSSQFFMPDNKLMLSGRNSCDFKCSIRF